jgi:hypothetical protein
MSHSFEAKNARAGDSSSSVHPPRIKRSSRKDVDRSPEFRWLKEQGSRYLGQWVALSGETLVAHSSALKGLLAKLEGKELNRTPLIHRID